jgi:hypothetical protein
MDLAGLGQGSAAGCCEHCNEPSGEIFDQMRDY